MKGLGNIFLKHSLDILASQTFKDFDVVITDNSRTNLIKNLCNEYQGVLDIKYHQNDKNVGMTANVNNSIKKATGKLIKILFQDDFLYDTNSLENIVRSFDIKKDHWLITACEHSQDGVNFYRPFYPKYNNKIYLGNNTISSPSVLTIKNGDPLLFDEKLSWLMDCDYYKRCYDKYGEPKILNTITVVNRIGGHQTTNATDDFSKKAECWYVSKKYKEGAQSNIQLGKIKKYIYYFLGIP